NRRLARFGQTVLIDALEAAKRGKRTAHAEARSPVLKVDHVRVERGERLALGLDTAIKIEDANLHGPPCSRTEVCPAKQMVEQTRGIKQAEAWSSFGSGG